MQYAMLGRTGYRVSRLGFGAMRLPMKDGLVDRDLAIPMIHKAFEGGVNYIDTAVGYCESDSQSAVGEALRGWRDRVVVSTKNHYFDEDEKEWWKNLEDSLARLGVDFIDIYNTHGINADALDGKVRPRVSKWLIEARDRGLIRHICTSFHDNNAALRKVVDFGLFESITLQYNMLDRQLEDGIAYAHEKNIGIVAMGPVGGGRLGEPNEQLARALPGIERIPELALRFVLSNPGVTMALSGMSTMRQVEENLAVASDSRNLSADERARMGSHLDRLKEMADLYCTGCGYCKPCPQEVDIPGVFNLYNSARVYGLWKQAKHGYAGLGKNGRGKPADACVDCGECEKKCPQHIPIRKQLKEAHKALAVSSGDCTTG